MATLSPKNITPTLSNVFTRKRRVEIAVFLLAILFAGFVGNYVALLVTRPITNMLTRFFVGIVVGLLVGVCMGILVKRTWGKVQTLFLTRNCNEDII